MVKEVVEGKVWIEVERVKAARHPVEPCLWAASCYLNCALIIPPVIGVKRIRFYCTSSCITVSSPTRFIRRNPFPHNPHLQA